MTIAVRGQQSREGAAHAARRSRRCRRCTRRTGRWDIVAELRADSLEAFDKVLGRIRQVDGIVSTETSLLLSTHKL
jgi:DNA-binding Lrp family transcriptional regulator